jgi:hypothetical protein
LSKFSGLCYTAARIHLLSKCGIVSSVPDHTSQRPRPVLDGLGQVRHRDLLLASQVEDRSFLLHTVTFVQGIATGMKR